MDSSLITCPNCQKQIPLTAALSHELKEQFVKDAENKVRSQVELELKDKIAESSELKKQNQDNQVQILELTKLIRDLKRQNEDKELELQKKLLAAEEQTREAAFKKADEEYRLKMLEYDKKLHDALDANNELRRKLEQGSQQTQGEALEINLEDTLRNAFLTDDIEPVGKGLRGADVSHTVRSPKGFSCGIILWEFKNTKDWKEEWVGKLKDDLRSVKANVGVIATAVLPKDCKNGMGLHEGLWVTTPELIIPLAMLLRQCFLDTAYQKAVQVNQGKKADLLYDYVTGHEFKQQVEALAEVCAEMRDQLSKERTAFERIWKARETQIVRLVSSTTGVYGSMQGLLGSSLPQIPGLDLDSGESESKLLN